MSTAEASLSERSKAQARVEDLALKTAELAVGLFVAGAALYYAVNWSLATTLTFIRPLDKFWAGPMLAAALYLAWTVWKAVRDDNVSISLDSLDAALDLVAKPALVLLLFVLVHAYLL